MVNIFAFFEPKRGWRHLDVTDRRTAVDFALAMRRLIDEHYPDANKVRIRPLLKPRLSLSMLRLCLIAPWPPLH
jgi:hypothetical protein